MNASEHAGNGAAQSPEPTAEQVANELSLLGPVEAAERLEAMADTFAFEVMQRINPAVVADIIPNLDEARRKQIFLQVPHDVTAQWSLNQTFEEDSVGRLMDPPVGVFGPNETVAEVTESVRHLVKRTLITYCFVIDERQRLIGVVTMRDLLISDENAKISTVMLRNPFCLRPNTLLPDAMKEVVQKHFPVYPVCDDSGRLIGLVRGQSMFEEQAFEISAQPGRMVGVDKEERLSTPWPRSLKFRHPWLQLNLFTAFLAAAVVGIFQGTLDKLVILAVFLPVLAGQSGNTGCQALAVTLRGLTLGEFKDGSARTLVAKEALLGLLNGALVGVTAGIGMFIFARMEGNASPLALGGIVALAMTGSCVVSGLAGALIPLTLKRLGADPATASSIFLTTATDVVSMGMFLGLSTMLLT